MELIHETPPPILTEHGIEFFLETTHPGTNVHLHTHPAIEFIYIKQGLFHIDAEGRRFCGEAGDLLLFHANTIHMLQNIGDGNGLYYVLKMSPTFLFGMFHKSSIAYIHPFLKRRNEDPCFFPCASLPLEIHRLWQAMIAEYEANEPSFFAMQRLLSCEFLLTCARLLLYTGDGSEDHSPRLSERTVRLISDSIHYIHENLAAPLTASGCASLAHLSYNHYAKLFHAVTGKTFKQYLTDLRMARAYNMTRSSSSPISEIAMACGYENFSYFIAEFKKAHGCTPGRLRKSTHPLKSP